MSKINQQPSQSNQGPFSILNLLMAGVGPTDVVWYRGLRTHTNRMQALQSSARGRAILETVHRHEQSKLAAAMPQLA